MIALSDQHSLLAALARARRIDAAVYLPAPGFARALEDAARRGADVTLHVAGTMPAGSGRERALDAWLPALRRAGVHVVMESENIEHLKAVVVDGCEAFLADRNFAQDETVLRSDEAQAVAAAIEGRCEQSSDLVLGQKGDVQEMEAALVRTAPAGSEVLAVSEYANFSPLVRVMLERAGELHERLVVAQAGTAKPLEAKALAALAAKGVDVEIAQAAEKGLFVGTAAVVTSANATVGQASMSEWAARLDGSQAQALRAHFDALLAHAHARRVA